MACTDKSFIQVEKFTPMLDPFFLVEYFANKLLVINHHNYHKDQVYIWVTRIDAQTLYYPILF
jgi:hypothetical protein